MRIGHGYDVHRFTDGDEIIIGGVTIPHNMGILAHSDGDVLIHAIIDALFGAAGEKDIGNHFPDTDNAYKNIDSKLLLAQANDIIFKKGFEIEYIDSTIVAQSPKMAPHLDSMRATLAKILNIDFSQINVKATTEEHLGFTGRKEGLSAHAVCLLRNKE